MTLLFAQISGKDSLREIENALLANHKRLYHLGMEAVTKSTLSEAMNRRNLEIFKALFEEILDRVMAVVPKHKFKFKNPLYAVLFPKVQLSFLLTSRRMILWRLWHWISLPAWAVFVLWMVFQSIMAFAAEMDSAGGVAYSAHIGGAIFGLLAGTFLVLSKKEFK